MSDDARKLVGRWVHVHEEDDSAHRVFRRAGSPLPPSRGRTELEISADLTVRQTGPGPDDRLSANGIARIGFGPNLGADGRYLRVADVDANRLLVVKD